MKNNYNVLQILPFRRGKREGGGKCRGSRKCTYYPKHRWIEFFEGGKRGREEKDTCKGRRRRKEGEGACEKGKKVGKRDE
mgnify:CR=1 FL=1